MEGDNAIPLSATLLRRAPGLRSLLQRHLGGTADLGLDDDDVDDEEDWGPRRRTTSTREPFFHVCTEPKAEGLLLERGGEFGKTPRKLMEGRRALRDLSTNVNDILRRREVKWRPQGRQNLGQVSRAVAAATWADVMSRSVCLILLERKYVGMMRISIVGSSRKVRLFDHRLTFADLCVDGSFYYS